MQDLMRRAIIWECLPKLIISIEEKVGQFKNKISYAKKHQGCLSVWALKNIYV